MRKLPLVESPIASSPRSWEGFTPAGEVLAAPEPVEPQGAYAAAASLRSQRLVWKGKSERPVELLAPAGGPDAGFAALAYGADAIYLGLKKFSARAEAENFTIDEVDEITAYAHGLNPPKRVFVTINTLIQQGELAELVEAVARLAQIGIDALIIQDLGVLRLVRQHFPALELHASTQMAVHNRAGAEALAALGFRRVVLARELTFEEVADVTQAANVETEVFIHGALCYSYSGLCLFSSQTLSRSGNRGKCAYSCRDAYEVTGAPMTLRDGEPVRRDPSTGFPFSMKDLALPDHLPALRDAGVVCFKIEGRKKSPLYVATVTEYYRQLLDGDLTEGERPEREADLRSVFSRPWTQLFIDSHRDKEVADRDTVGHRGTLVGRVERVLGGGKRSPRLRFRTIRPLERHDGLQIDLPTLGKPFGFAVDQLWIVNPGERREHVVAAPGGVEVEVALPADHPALESGWPVYCSSSQAVKRRYRLARPRPGWHHHRQPIDVVVTLGERACSAHAFVEGEEARASITGTFAPARDPAAMAEAVHSAFAKLGDTRLALRSLTTNDPETRFVPVSQLNRLRRDLVTEVERLLAARASRRIEAVVREVVPPREETAAQPMAKFAWSIKIDRLAHVACFTDDDWQGVDELIVDVARDSLQSLEAILPRLAATLDREHIRLALPAITRKWEERNVEQKIDALTRAGWLKWEAANLSAWSYLRQLDLLSAAGPQTKGTDARIALDLATDWSVYVVNRLAALQLMDMGVTRFALSPEDGLANYGSLLREFGPRAVLIVHQDTPLFLAESCAYANLIGGCPGKANCRFESMEMVSSHGEKVTALDYHCRTIVLNQGPYCLSTRLKDLARAGAVSLRADFIYRPYDPEVVRQRWRQVRAGRAVPGGHWANLERGML